MAVKQLNPYLNFDGTATKAIALYEEALGAKTENLSRFGDLPGANPPADQKDRVIHALLRLGPGTIMISDTQHGQTVTNGNNNYVCLDFDEPSDMTAKFTALGKGGKVDVPLQDTFWGAKFGI